MKQFFMLSIIISMLFFTGCFAPKLKPIKVEMMTQQIDYLADVKPILDKRCVSCHSCYNAPCQLKMSSFEGMDRGASKIKVYDAMRLSAIDPTRLFMDAKNTEEWQKKGFYSMTASNDDNKTHNNSLLLQVLNHKKKNPKVQGTYSPENDDLACPKNNEELSEYYQDNPNHGMPYGFPQINKNEYQTLANWLQQGAKGPSPKQQKQITSASFTAEKEIRKWENFFNTQDAKHSLTARYLYEHFYLAHWSFKPASKEFYEMVRSKTPAPEPIDVISTLRPFDDPKVDKFYYRIRRIHSTIVHKTHMVVEFDDAKLKELKKLFIETKWTEKPHLVGYDSKASANPFLVYAQIPPASRYKFLLRNAHYIIMTFIRGPVCRGQMALNVIDDHFWVMFKDPKYDISVQDPNFLLQNADNLSLPIETTSKSVFKVFSDEYRDRANKFLVAKEKRYDKKYPEGLGLESIWKGDSAKDAPLLTIYRHFNSASVHKGVLGELPKSAWVIDYPQFERIYYTLVAGYDIFGNVSHQTNLRRYMDFLRIEGEFNFLSYMPKSTRLDMFKSWYIGEDIVQGLKALHIKRPSKIAYKTAHPKSEFIEKVVKTHILKSTNIDFDKLNYYKAGDVPPEMPKTFKKPKDYITAFRSLTAPGMGFTKHLIDQDANTVFVRIIAPDNKSYVFTIVINRWHDNVSSLFNMETTTNPDKDTMDFIEGPVGSYPNIFSVVHYTDLVEFFDVLKNYDGSKDYNQKIVKYFVSRSDPKFWETFDWFQKHFDKKEPLQSGLYDLNRYSEKVW
jgi:hypothetical protein